jgi:manganese efflux pump family protein
MPVVGLLPGRALGQLIGGAADYVAIGALTLLGVWMLVHEDDDERERVGRLASGHGLVLIALSISLDELAIGFTIGLLHLSLWLAVILIGAQAFTVAQLGLRLGARLSETIAGIALIGLALLLVVEQLT